MGFFKKLFGGSDPDAIILEIQERVNLPYHQFQSLDEAQLHEISQNSLACYTQGLAADEAGQPDIANRLYRKAFECFPFNIEALDNCALNLMLQSNFAEAIPLLEQSLAAEQNNPLAYRYLIYCNREAGTNQSAYRLIKAYEKRWPGDPPFVDLTRSEPDPALEACLPFKPGQVWRYKTRDSDPESRIWIRFLQETVPGEYAAHISVTNVAVAENQKHIFASHLPVSIDVLKQSTTELTEEQQTWETEDDEFGAGYRMWFDSFSEGKAGVFTIPMIEIIDLLTQAAPKPD